MTEDEAIAALDALDAGDPEQAHDDVDSILLEMVSPAVAAAARRVVQRAKWWATA